MVQLVALAGGPESRGLAWAALPVALHPGVIHRAWSAGIQATVKLEGVRTLAMPVGGRHAHHRLPDAALALRPSHACRQHYGYYRAQNHARLHETLHSEEMPMVNGGMARGNRLPPRLLLW